MTIGPRFPGTVPRTRFTPILSPILNLTICPSVIAPILMGVARISFRGGERGAINSETIFLYIKPGSWNAELLHNLIYFYFVIY